MPIKGYGTIGLKPAILLKLQKATDEYYPGMFLPSALIILMNEIKREYYSVEMHNMKVDFSGTYTSLTIRRDVKEWLEENYENLKEEYQQKYKINNFTKFASIFTLNMFESKAKAQNNVVKLNESDFRWLFDEYQRQQKEYDIKYGTQTFEQFADKFLKELFEKLYLTKKL